MRFPPLECSTEPVHTCTLRPSRKLAPTRMSAATRLAAGPERPHAVSVDRLTSEQSNSVPNRIAFIMPDLVVAGSPANSPQRETLGGEAVCRFVVQLLGYWCPSDVRDTGYNTQETAGRGGNTDGSRSRPR